MSGILHWLWVNFVAVYPNLEASALTFGAGMVWHHWLMGKKLDRLHDRMDVLHAKVEALHVEVTDGTGDGRHAAPEPPQ